MLRQHLHLLHQPQLLLFCILCCQTSLLRGCDTSGKGWERWDSMRRHQTKSLLTWVLCDPKGKTSHLDHMASICTSWSVIVSKWNIDSHLKFDFFSSKAGSSLKHWNEAGWQGISKRNKFLQNKAPKGTELFESMHILRASGLQLSPSVHLQRLQGKLGRTAVAFKIE